MTPEREKKFKNVLAQRQTSLTIILENVHDPHNVSAVLRSCDGVGIIEVYNILTIPAGPYKLGKRSSASAKKWVQVHTFDNVDECIAAVRKKYDHIYTTFIDENSKSLYELDLTQSVALVFGNEGDGISPELMKHSDGNFKIPMMGMVQSLNISVACAVSLYEALRQRERKGMYTNPQLPQDEIDTRFADWEKRDLFE